MWLLKQLLTCPVYAAVKAEVGLKSSAKLYYEGALMSYSNAVQLLLKRYANDDNKAKLKANVCSLKKGSENLAECAQ